MMGSRKLPLYLLAAATLAALLAFAQTIEYDGVEVFFSTKGVVNVRHEGFTKTTGIFKTWGPNWQWIGACSWQDDWVSLKASMGDTDASFEGAFQCDFAKVSWRERAWLGLDSFLIELNLTADADSSFAGMAWDFDLPIPLFAGKRVTLLLSNGTQVSVKLREEHIPGTWVIDGSAYPNGVGWVIPYDGDRGLVVAVLGDTWPNGLSVDAEDNRQWGGNTYSLRNWLFFDLQMPKGVIVRLLVYVHPYSSQDELEVGLSRVREAVRMLQGGESSDAVKSFLISAMNLEEAAAARKARGPPLMLIVYAAIAVVAVAVIAFALLQRRRS
jgi:hypothetical protein